MEETKDWFTRLPFLFVVWFILFLLFGLYWRTDRSVTVRDTNTPQWWTHSTRQQLAWLLHSRTNHIDHEWMNEWMNEDDDLTQASKNKGCFFLSDFIQKVENNHKPGFSMLCGMRRVLSLIGRRWMSSFSSFFFILRGFFSYVAAACSALRFLACTGALSDSKQEWDDILMSTTLTRHYQYVFVCTYVLRVLQRRLYSSV